MASTESRKREEVGTGRCLLPMRSNIERLKRKRLDIHHPANIDSFPPAFTRVYVHPQSVSRYKYDQFKPELCMCGALESD